jgi:hypothetical protein
MVEIILMIIWSIEKAKGCVVKVLNQAGFIKGRGAHFIGPLVTCM